MFLRLSPTDAFILRTDDDDVESPLADIFSASAFKINASAEFILKADAENMFAVRKERVWSAVAPNILKHIYNHYANFLKLRYFANKNKTHKKIMATICRGFRRRRQRQRRRQVYFKSSTDSGGDCTILLAARTILERQKSGVTACHRSDIKVIKLNGLENTDSQMRIKKKTW